MQQLTSKVYNGAVLPTFDELGIRVPQTVFFRFGSPVLWYYPCDQGKQGKGLTLMRRNAENTNLPNVLAVFKDEHARAIGQAIQVIHAPMRYRLRVYVCVACTRVCCVRVWVFFGGKRT